MRVLIDADGCPVVNSTIRICGKHAVPCLIFCDTAHQINREGAITYVVDKGADSADFRIANSAEPGDIVITQDYGVASMCLAKNARVLHQDGWEYTQWNIDALMFERHEARKFRASGGRTKGPHRRTNTQDQAFEKALDELLSDR